MPPSNEALGGAGMRPSLVVYGSLLDSLECEPYVDRKRDDLVSRLAGRPPLSEHADPFDALLSALQSGLKSVDVAPAGKVSIDDWLRPVPKADPMNLMMVSMTSYQAYNDSGGPEDYTKQTYDTLLRPERLEAVTETSLGSITELPEHAIPLMLGVDHSVSGAPIQALSERYGSEDLVLVVLDYHADIRPTHVSVGLSQWDVERRGMIWLEGPRPDRYEAGSFLYYLFERNIVLPENTILIGPVAYPTKRLRLVEDPRVQEYVELYDSLVERGLKIIHRSKFNGPSWRKDLAKVLGDVNGSHLYLSLDSDVGVLNAINATRLIHFGRPEIPMKGLGLSELIEIARELCDWVSKNNIKLAGIDAMEMDVMLIDRTLSPQLEDQTSNVLVEFLSELLSGFR